MFCSVSLTNVLCELCELKIIFRYVWVTVDAFFGEELPTLLATRFVAVYLYLSLMLRT